MSSNITTPCPIPSKSMISLGNFIRSTSTIFSQSQPDATRKIGMQVPKSTITNSTTNHSQPRRFFRRGCFCPRLSSCAPTLRLPFPSSSTSPPFFAKRLKKTPTNVTSKGIAPFKIYTDSLKLTASFFPWKWMVGSHEIFFWSYFGFEKYAQVKLGSSSLIFGVTNKKYLSCHHLVFFFVCVCFLCWFLTVPGICFVSTHGILESQKRKVTSQSCISLAVSKVLRTCCLLVMLTNLTHLTDAVSRDLFFLYYVLQDSFFSRTKKSTHLCLLVEAHSIYWGYTHHTFKAGNPYSNGTYEPLRIIALMSRPPLLPSLKQT